MLNTNCTCWRLTPPTLNKDRKLWLNSATSAFKNGKTKSLKCRTQLRKLTKNQLTNHSSSWLSLTCNKFQIKISKFTSLRKRDSKLNPSCSRKLIKLKLKIWSTSWANWSLNSKPRLSTESPWSNQWSSNLKICSRDMKPSKIATWTRRESKMQSILLKKIFFKNGKSLFP